MINNFTIQQDDQLSSRLWTGKYVKGFTFQENFNFENKMLCCWIRGQYKQQYKHSSCNLKQKKTSHQKLKEIWYRHKKRQV